MVDSQLVWIALDGAGPMWGIVPGQGRFHGAGWTVVDLVALVDTQEVRVLYAPPCGPLEFVPGGCCSDRSLTANSAADGRWRRGSSSAVAADCVSPERSPACEYLPELGEGGGAGGGLVDPAGEPDGLVAVREDVPAVDQHRR